MNSLWLSLYDSVDNNDLTNLKRYVNLYRIDLNDRFTTVRKRVHAGLSPIHLASSRGHVEMLRFILNNKCDVNSTTETLQRTALHYAVLRHQAACLRLLLAHDADVRVPDIFGNTPCHYAAQDGDVDIINKLINKGADINVEDSTLKTPLIKAVWNAKVDAVKCLLEAGCHINGTDINRETALHFAARINKPEIIEYLITAGIKLNSRNKNGRTPLLEAVEYNKINNVRKLVHAKCDVSIADFEFQETAPLFAIRKNYTSMLEIFLANGVTQNVSRSIGESMFLSAIENNKVDAFRLLLSYNCDRIITYRTFNEFLKSRESLLETLNLANVRSFSEYAIRRGSIEVGLILAYVHCDYISRKSEVANMLTEVDSRAAGEIDVTLFPSLVRMCRKVVRSCLSYKIRQETEALPIPTSLKGFILLSDISQ